MKAKYDQFFFFYKGYWLRKMTVECRDCYWISCRHALTFNYVILRVFGSKKVKNDKFLFDISRGYNCRRFFGYYDDTSRRVLFIFWWCWVLLGSKKILKNKTYFNLVLLWRLKKKKKIYLCTEIWIYFYS